MKKMYKKQLLSLVALCTMAIVQSCQDKGDVKPASLPVSDQSVSLLDEIKALGFDASSIQDKGSYYLAEGDIYFSKSKISRRILSVREKPKVKIPRGQRPSITIAIDGSVRTNTAWRDGIDHAITTWNANSDHHFSFEIINNTEKADIFFQDDNGELSEDVEIASEFAAHGYVGATVHLNLDYAHSSAEQVKTKALEGLSHSVGLRHADLNQKQVLKTETAARTQSTPRDYLYLISGDFLWAEGKDGSGASLASTGWAGSTCITSTYDMLYVIQFDVLYAARPDGSWWGLSEGWSGTQAMTGLSAENAVYAIQGDDLWGINPADGSWWSIPASYNGDYLRNVNSMCEAADKKLYIMEGSRGINGIYPNTVSVSVDPTSPSYKRIVYDDQSSIGVWQNIAPYFKYGSTYHEYFYIDSDVSHPENFGLNATLTPQSCPGPGACLERIHPISSNQGIDYTKTQGMVGDNAGTYKHLYLLIDGGIYSFTYNSIDYDKPGAMDDHLTTIRYPHVWSPTAIMTNLVPTPLPKISKNTPLSLRSATN